MSLNIVLVEPEIPQNTGNIARTCAATGSTLHLVRPLGFTITDAKLKRAGLDYWDKLNIYYYDSFQEVLDKFYNGKNFWFYSTKSQKTHTQVEYHDGDFLVFGKESHGLPEPLLKEHYAECVRIPMIGELRSLNLSNSVAIGVYEAIRQIGYEEFNTVGHLTGKKKRKRRKIWITARRNTQ
ncbi:MAG: tRNA (uridine(34)/cytosine(34)/5-carboxymethylaminomethyluridine(34)-2'-O)-methyltransferase TrmL [Clostridia bacterium]|nr:tRNA (uridine(34)/cytosine(34)/5-carboxymethylaminomethyluridine(34)-2'-O)-methyltransferase TrmL [Clostridia bacterium]